MHHSIKNISLIEEELKSINQKTPSIIAVSKTFPISDILPLIKNGHIHFGENKVQEAIEKWPLIKKDFDKVNLHLIGKLQTNKVKFVLPLFDYIHSLDNEKLAKKISEEQKKHKKKPKLFIQVNIGEEVQKNGISKKNLRDFHIFCKDLNLDVIGLMCIPPNNTESKLFFEEMNNLKNELNMIELSMGMSADYIEATKNSSTFLRIGSKIFGLRS
tara:strand:- start:1755 stop:2399 length:645 start_codon:yes stop_codon:yes gene_type:complete